jgi:hypothetical protein
MFTRSVASCVAVFVVAGLAPLASAGGGWIESSQGDLSNDRLNPTLVPLAIGNNRVSGNTQEGDRDFLTITILPGQTLDQLVLEFYASEDGAAFIGVQTGPILSVDPDNVVPSDLYGWALFGPSHNNLGENILPEMGTNFGAQGFVPPLTEGTYTFWIQQLGPSTDYTFNFVVVPAPSAAALFAVGALGLVRRRR